MLEWGTCSEATRRPLDRRVTCEQAQRACEGGAAQQPTSANLGGAAAAAAAPAGGGGGCAGGAKPRPFAAHPRPRPPPWSRGAWPAREPGSAAVQRASRSAETPGPRWRAQHPRHSHGLAAGQRPAGESRPGAAFGVCASSTLLPGAVSRPASAVRADPCPISPSQGRPGHRPSGHEAASAWLSTKAKWPAGLPAAFWSRHRVIGTPRDRCQRLWTASRIACSSPSLPWPPGAAQQPWLATAQQTWSGASRRRTAAWRSRCRPAAGARWHVRAPVAWLGWRCVPHIDVGPLLPSQHAFHLPSRLPTGVPRTCYDEASARRRLLTGT